MNKRIAFWLVSLVALVALSLAGLGTASSAKTTMLKAALNAGQEVPHAKGSMVGASGRFTGLLTKSGTHWTLTWKVTYTHLTGPAAAAHIHKAPRGVAGNVLVAICPPSCHSGMSGTRTVTTAIANAILSGGTYVNVHTAKNPGGEIRGQITKA